MTEILFARKDDVDTVTVINNALAAAASAAAALVSQNAASTSASAAATSATNASTSATNSATSATNSAASATAAANSATSTNKSGLNYNFDTATSMADPGAAKIRLNNATLASVTAIALSVNMADSGNPSARAYISTWGASSSVTKATLVLRKATAPENFAIYTITAAASDNTTWEQLTVSYVTSSGSFSASDAMLVFHYRTGDAGTGSISGMTAHGIPIATNGTTIASTVNLTDGQLIVGATGVDPTARSVSGDITLSSTGVVALVNIPSTTPMAGSLLSTAIVAPGTPAAGKASVYVDSTTKALVNKDDAGTLHTTIVADTGASNNFLTAISASGVISKAQPSAANLSNGTTGSGAVVLATSPTLVTPTLGVATVTSVNGLAISASTGILTISGSKQLVVSNTLTLAGTDGTTMTFPNTSSSIGYLNVPQNSQSAAYTTVLADSGKHLYHPASDGGNARTYTIDSNANVPYPIGTVIMFINDTSGAVFIVITTDTLVLAGTGSTGGRTLAQNGVATAIKVTSTRWIISGTGIS